MVRKKFGDYQPVGPGSATGRDKASSVGHNGHTSYLHLHLHLGWRLDHLLYYDHLRRVPLLPLGQQRFRHVHAGSDIDEVMLAVVR